jgi:hypothetical protein
MGSWQQWSFNNSIVNIHRMISMPHLTDSLIHNDPNSTEGRVTIINLLIIYCFSSPVISFLGPKVLLRTLPSKSLRDRIGFRSEL